jgi:hypothetical protein
LEKAVGFYGAQRSGTEHNWILNQYPNAAACFTEDGFSYQNNLDLSGGWHDAGDNIKFTTTIAWSAYALLKAYDAFPNAFHDKTDFYFGEPNGIPDVLDEVKWAIDYLVKIHLDSATLVSQIGDYRDHNHGLTCVTMSTSGEEKGGNPRTVWFGNSNSSTTETKADLLGITAAALALMSNMYKNFDNDYANSLISHARQLYTTAKDRPGVTKEPPNQSYYKDASYHDDLSCAAVELGRVTGNTSYIDEAVQYHNQVGNHNWVVDWAQHIDYCRHSLAKAGKGDDVKSQWKSDVDRYRGKVTQQQYVKGLAFFLNWGSLRYALNAGFSAALYHDIYNDSLADTFAKSQINYVMGDNEYDRSFIVGWGKNAPQRPHHKNAFGKDSWFNANSIPLYELTGALVGGPHNESYSDGSLTSPAGYQDKMNDYVSNEVTIDYNIGLVGLTAFQGRNAETGLSSISNSSSSEATTNLRTKVSLQKINSENVLINPRNHSIHIQIFDIKGAMLNNTFTSKSSLSLNPFLKGDGLYYVQWQESSNVYVEKILITKP